MPYKYSKQFDKEKMAKAVGISLPISTKQAIEICNFVRNKNLQKAKGLLEDVINKQKAVPFKRFHGDVGHKKGMAAGRFPFKASKEILKMLKLAEANAQFKGLDVNSLVVSHMCAQRAAKQWHYGRKRRRKAKRTHIEVFVEEVEKKKTKKEGKAKTAAPSDKSHPPSPSQPPAKSNTNDTNVKTKEVKK